MPDKLSYDDTNYLSIESHGKKLQGHSLRELYGNDAENLFSGKGSLGQLVELIHFGYQPNSNPQPDFPEAGVELKTTPLKINTKGLVSKERLVFNIIDYFNEYKQTFKESSFWKKNGLILLIFYLYEKEKLELDYIFKIVRLWRFPLTDLKIIRDDWFKIVQKIKDGKAHEISEGDTLYLGACTKGSTALKSRVAQPFSNEKAQKRAFSLKSKYLNFIIQKSLKGDLNLTVINEPYQEFLDEIINVVEEEPAGYGDLFTNYEAVIKNISDYKKGQTFEDFIVERFEKYYGQSEDDIKKEFGLTYNPKAKNKGQLLARAILGIKKEKIEEFEKAEIEIKTVKLEKSGTLKESMSFAQIKYKEILEEQWEDSYLFNTLTKRFFFVVFKKVPKGSPILEKVMFWTMSARDLKQAKVFWLDIKNKVQLGIYEDFWKLSDHLDFHVRPKGQNAKDLMETPQGTMQKKKCYWLNSEYVLRQVNDY